LRKRPDAVEIKKECDASCPGRKEAMVEYGTLIGRPLAEQLGSALHGFIDMVTGFHWSWYIVALILLFLLTRLLIKK
jgi:hypothetical protein